MVYTYFRNFDSETGKYAIDYDNESPKILDEIKSIFPGKSILINCNHMDISIDITPELTVGEKLTLDDLVEEHQANPSPSRKPYKLTGQYSDPRNLEINIFGLFRKDTFNALGALSVKEYYSTYENGVYSDLVVKDEYNYYYNQYGLVTHRDEVITWYLEDGEVGITKTIRKYYDNARAILEANQRRQNLVNQAQAYGMANITGWHVTGMHNGHHFFLSIKNEIDNYIVGVLKEELISAIENHLSEYLTSQMKSDLVDILEYWD